MLKLTIATLVGATALMSAPAPAQAQQYQHGRDAEITCSSHNSHYMTCRKPYRGTAHLVHQLSKQSCVRGRSWGEQGDSRVWVSQGCRAVFAVRPDRHYDDNRVGDNRYDDNRNGDTRYDNRNGDTRYDDNRNGDTRYEDNRSGDNWTRDRNYSVECRADGGRNTCDWDNRYGTPYLMQRTSGECVEGRDWGYDREGRIWVDDNCSARFGYHN
jgi:hypothetical protein